MSHRKLEAPANLRREASAPADRFDLGLLAMIAGWFVLALLAPFVAVFLIFEIGLRWTLYVILASLVAVAALVLFSTPRQSGATVGSRLMAVLVAVAGLPVIGFGLVMYVGSALIVGAIFWTMVLGLPGG